RCDAAQDHHEEQKKPLRGPALRHGELHSYHELGVQDQQDSLGEHGSRSRVCGPCSKVPCCSVASAVGTRVAQVMCSTGSVQHVLWVCARIAPCFCARANDATRHGPWPADTSLGRSTRFPPSGRILDVRVPSPGTLSNVVCYHHPDRDLALAG